MLTITISPRFGDVDGFRHINNTRLPEWFESGRMPLYRIFQPQMDLDQLNLIIARITVDFQSQMFMQPDVEIRTWIKRVGNSSFTVYQEAWQQGRLGASGETVVVHYDFAAGHSLPIPGDIRPLLEQHLLPEEQQNQDD